MRFYSETLGLPENAFAILRDLIHERTGMHFDNGKRDLLAGKLSSRVLERGFSSFLDYYYLLKYDAGAEDEWRHVLDALSVPETYFWREADQVQALVHRLVPQFESARSGPLRIWSAACASGEEPLSIAMALHEAGMLPRCPIEIVASDASPACIEKARRGLYRDRSFRSLPAYLKAKYFTEENGSWRIKPEIHEHVTWRLANLLDETATRELAAARFIFCRNVFIYFSDKAVQKTVQRFHQCMPTPAYLFVGASESLVKLTTDFDLREIAGAFVYVKD